MEGDPGGPEEDMVGHGELWPRIKKAWAPRLAEYRRLARLLRQNKLALLGLFLVLGNILVALAAPILAPPENDRQAEDPYKMEEHFKYGHVGSLKEPGEDGYILGTTEKGYDLWYGIIWGARISLAVAIVVVASATLISSLVGVTAGKVDEAIMHITDVFLAIPGLVLALAIVAVVNKPSIIYIMLALVFVWWPGYTRIIRSQALVVRQQGYVEAARAAGASNGHIILRHILPNCLSPILITATMDFGSVVLVLAALGFLGFGGSPDLAEWGKLVSFGQEHLTSGEWWAFIFPGMAIAIFALGFYLLGDGLRDILDPRQRR